MPTTRDGKETINSLVFHQNALSDEILYSNLSTIIRNKFCIVAGDFNCSVNWKTQTADAENMRLLDFANEEYLTQWVDKPTRGNNTLDLVFSSEDNMISKLSVGEKLSKSDHNMIRFEILTSFTKLEKSFMKPNFQKADFNRLRCEIRKLPKSGGTDAELNWFSFKTVYESSMLLHSSKKNNTKWNKTARMI